uniref:Uncharacterized protein n=1 Tax=Glossina palpalis gambiensis TaxID=67801 RepID=A0A1B0B744_9MUSC
MKRPIIKLFFIVQNKPQNILVFIHPRKPHQKVTVSHYTVRRANFASSGFRETGAQCSSQDHFIDLRTTERDEWRMDRLISLPKALICSSRRVSQKKLPRLLECSKLTADDSLCWGKLMCRNCYPVFSSYGFIF